LVQTTLLGLSLAIILALVAALVGPHFVDWTNYRAAFEREATRLAGVPVRINGAIDVRLLPTPTLTLGKLEAGDAAAPLLAARELYAELSLGSLVRGEFRASDMRVVAPDIKLALGTDGRLTWPAVRMGFDADQLMIDRIAIEGGRLSFADSASGAATLLEGLWFNGELRSLLGPVKGEGGFTAAGDRYGYRVAAGRVGDDGTMKLRVSLDPADYPVNLVADGSLRFDASVPRFDGALSVARPVAVAGANGRGVVVVPWRMTSRVKATPAQALFEQVEYQYGPDERALKLAGTADFRFGKTPRLDGVLSARQADLDRALDLPDTVRRVPLAAVKQVIESVGVAFRPPFPVRLGIGLDAVTLAGGTLQGLRGDLNMTADGWDIETLEFRAPGFTQVRLSGRLAVTAQDVAFKGPARVEANDPKALIAWLEGRTADAAQAPLGVMRASGDLTIGAQEIAADRLRVEVDRRTIEGRLRYSQAAAGRATRLEAELKAAELDIDALLAFGRAALDGTAFEKPGEVALTADIGRATIAGVEAKGVKGTLTLDVNGLSFDRVQVADLAGASFNLNGRMDGPLSAPQGSVAFDVDARGLEGTTAVLEKFLPEAAAPVRGAAAKLTPLKARVTLKLERAAAGGSTAKLSLDGNAGALVLRIATEATGDLAALTLPDMKLDAQVSATDGSTLIALAGLDKWATVDRRPGALTLTARGAAGGDLRVDARLTAGNLNATANGTARLFAANGLSAALDVSVQADAAPLRRVTNAAALPVALRARINAGGDDIAIENLTGAIAGSPVRGRLKFSRGATTRVEGRIDAEAVDAAALIASAIGMPASASRTDGRWPAEPFGEGLFGEYEGRVEFSLARATLTPALAGRQVRGALRLGTGEFALEDLEGTLAGGRATGQFTVRRAPAGLAAALRFSLLNADATALLPGEGRPAVTGRVALQADLEGTGLSPAALIGAFDGSGTIALEDAALAGLDPRAFGVAMRSADQTALDAAKVRDIVSTVLDGGPLAVPRLDAALTVTAGQVRTSRIVVPGQGADLTLAGSLDLAESTLDARLTLTGPMPSDGFSTTRPDILVLLKGPVSAPKRTVDVSALSGWLMLRSVDRQAKRLDAIEAERRNAAAREPPEPTPTPASVTPQAPAPAPVPTPAPPVSAALPAPAAPDTAAPPPEPAPAAPQVRPHRPPRPATSARTPDQPPPLPPPLEITPAPGNAKQRQNARPPANAPPPPATRSTLDLIFGPLR
jgi:large subunit ribosomal protein L24